ncbi:DUF397 domain-containing protein [Streptomyces coeruleorubidus]|uniref:DUF397 domain-containing protein n=1 Tax=Streptomyces coeruleorubidus TaxID=116188 RepID=A0ABZ0KD84_STRC4|nr:MULTISPECIES: DUF397 domain-containing protein [Streptomyces]WOT35708.1 DUF397 domain-containing protein [Streptomyces coeruleorubidus]GGU37109.1 hypothetical protein GCM10010244_74290 [Streptomyces bellus]
MNRTLDLGTVVWRKSSYSDGGQTNCLEVADGHPGMVPVRDSKQSDGPILVFSANPWTSFLAGVKDESSMRV